MAKDVWLKLSSSSSQYHTFASWHIAYNSNASNGHLTELLINAFTTTNVESASQATYQVVLPVFYEEKLVAKSKRCLKTSTINTPWGEPGSPGSQVEIVFFPQRLNKLYEDI
ncbi:hypothetical protein SERLA73DRAFT_188167 [Serpula lacrymans var. lacrymans S7.3]|uniref:Uncharacterized protein n=2 Tax=Serpula lacrymans var. lacrymans TaxID=341189 RepID=F8QAV0_SERL3|nr:uncharacterized protein SERLADRAFT_453152 [Serpula lacrymans var. lacrymans S7.9]EGN94336.1 hypothetical protein SERLA73DRAFT_188167 [Serpula lacrymans var. lacrymans S7.3]EGO19823.1 hypothetical protein SERLADRAFT_453152 [Serpula lacrymans var. lacrymans S7.9]